MRSRTLLAATSAALAAGAVLAAPPAAADPVGDGTPGASARLIGGQPAPASVTWTAALMYDAPSHGVYDQTTCASAVVTGRWVITAAQCVADLGIPGEIPARDKTFHVRAGLDRTAGGATANVTGTYINPHWTGEVHPPDETGDIVLLRLDKRLDVQTVPIAHASPQPGQTVTTYSWGSDEPGPRTNPDDLPRMLQQLDLTVLPKQQCADAGISRGEFCTSHAHYTGPAYGDAGGPAIAYDRQGRPRLVGIDSRGGSSVPGESNSAFTDVRYYETWIHETMVKNP
ncbi:trypsin-like serine protease [Amycolatopsis rubida]|uniref:Trypsin-like serine protease n=1 Tax=Amycolatopsis rubida TaxID=112413 RepID=A0ABX0BJR8_9PSEU|nr:trypsin-like serine protease [Amycolatopsis sp. M39]MYW90506.1 trypsin-like serine protease [Amycolatopsis rubida]MYW95126.1 trypsin-like serine protease [Amycolatopsis rubida]NEC55486.1 trypsin-like serine protease [Amycolatopsis rubida]NEC60113.1 trypsin-like serine protease [Amycolatopsis rubida]